MPDTSPKCTLCNTWEYKSSTLGGPKEGPAAMQGWCRVQSGRTAGDFLCDHFRSKSEVTKAYLERIK